MNNVTTTPSNRREQMLSPEERQYQLNLAQEKYRQKLISIDELEIYEGEYGTDYISATQAIAQQAKQRIVFRKYERRRFVFQWAILFVWLSVMVIGLTLFVVQFPILTSGRLLLSIAFLLLSLGMTIIQMRGLRKH